MKSSVSLGLTISLLLSTAPAFAMSTTDCNSLTGVQKTSCMRLKNRSNALKNGTTSSYIRHNRDTLKQVRRDRRSDVKDRQGVTRSTAANRATQLNNLKERRQTALQRRQSRVDQNRDRVNAVNSKRQNLLRKRIGAQVRTSARRGAIDKFQFRSNSRALDAKTQNRREAIKKAHESCRELRGSERLACIKLAREKALERTE